MVGEESNRETTRLEGKGEGARAIFQFPRLSVASWSSSLRGVERALTGCNGENWIIGEFHLCVILHPSPGLLLLQR